MVLLAMEQVGELQATAVAPAGSPWCDLNTNKQTQRSPEPQRPQQRLTKLALPSSFLFTPDRFRESD